MASESNGLSDFSATNDPAPSNKPLLDAEGEPIWKVLVFDDLGRDVISSVLRVNDLRARGVTVHLYDTRILPALELIRITDI